MDKFVSAKRVTDAKGRRYEVATYARHGGPVYRVFPVNGSTDFSNEGTLALLSHLQEWFPGEF
jgi:hypothetical protein